MNQVIFVVEDDVDVATLIRRQLESAGYSVEVFSDASTVLDAAVLSRPALFLLEIMLPHGDGRALCKQIRALPQLKTARVIFVTAKTSEADRLLGFELGADDYITKPFSPPELVARVRAVLRMTETIPSPALLRDGDVVLNLDAMSLYVLGRRVETTTTEFRLLRVLMESPGRIFHRKRLVEIVWGADRNVDPRSVDVYMSRLRDKIEGSNCRPRYLRTIRGVGYYFCSLSGSAPPPAVNDKCNEPQVTNGDAD